MASDTLFIGNIPCKCPESRLVEVFSDVGPVRRCHLIRPPNDKRPNNAYITFSSKEDAQAALQRSLAIDGCKLSVKPAKPKPTGDAPVEKIVKRVPTGRNRNGRLIIRNVSFKVTEASLRETFGPFGSIEEITIPKKPDGRLIGCCFVQFANANDAQKAMDALNFKPFLERQIAIDWCIPREKYLQATAGQTQPKEEVKDESDKSDSAEEEKPEPPKKKLKTENKLEKPRLESDESPESESEDDDQLENDSDNESQTSDVRKKKKPRKTFDVKEGKTLFVRNLSFDTTEEELRENFESFGEVVYCLICMDPDTEHSRGTAFVKFKDKESADSCLIKANDRSEKGGIFISDRRLNISVAITKNELQKQREERQKKRADSRRLYLAREGFVRPGTEAAQGVSEYDMNKRLEIERFKKRMLTNLNMFISDVRLCVRNLPADVDDRKLRLIFQKAGGLGSKLTEARVMRDMKRLDAQGLGISKEFGFVTFTEHKHALAALRQVNNNPTVFTRQRRPIVDFSIENRMVLNLRQKRLDRSRNPPQRSETQDSSIPTEFPVPHNEFTGITAEVDGPKLHVGAKVRHRDRSDPKKRKINRKSMKRMQQRQAQRTKAKIRKLQRKQNDRGEKGMAKGKKGTKGTKFDKMVVKHQKKGQKNNQKKKKWFDQ